MAYDGYLNFDTRINATGFQKDLDSINSIIQGMTGYKIIEKGFQVIVDSIDRAIVRYDTLKQFPKVMQGMGYGAEESAAAVKKLSDGVQGLPTSLDDIVSNTKRLVSVTGDLGKGTNTAIALNNAFLSAGASTADASRGLQQYIQMLSTGKVDVMSWRTLQETMIVSLNAVAKSFGFAGASATQDLYDALKNGNITMSEVNDRFIELNDGVDGFAEKAKTATGGINTAFTNMSSRIAAGVAEIISGIDNGLGETRFKSIENIINSVSTSIKSGLSGLAGGFEFLARNIEPVIVAVATFKIAWAGFEFLSYVGQLGSVTKAISMMTPELFKVIAAKAADKIETLSIMGLYAKEAIAKAASAAMTSLSAAAENGSVLAKGALAVATKAVIAAQWLWNAAMTANPIGLMVVAIAGLIAGVIALVSWLGKSKESSDEHSKAAQGVGEAWEETSGTVTEESAKQEQAMQEYEQAVKDRTAGIVNSFEEIPDQYEKSAVEMLDALKKNAENYASWEKNMEKITRELGPIAAEEFRKLGPEANSAIQEILGSKNLMYQYRKAFGDELTTLTSDAEKTWNNPDFTGAPAKALNSQAQQINQNTALNTSVTKQMEGAKKAAANVDFSTVGKDVSADIAGGIKDSSSKITTAVKNLMSAVQTAMKGMPDAAESDANQMMTDINSAITTKTGAVKSSSASLANAVNNAIADMGNKADKAITLAGYGITDRVFTVGGNINPTYTTILAWANAQTRSCNAMIISGAAFPTDSPVSSEAMVLLLVDASTTRKTVIWFGYSSSTSIRVRTIFNNAWLSGWYTVI